MINQDVIFYEEREWDFGFNADDFNFYPFEEDEQTSTEQVGEQQKPITPSTLPITTFTETHHHHFFRREMWHTRSLQDLYEEIDRLDNLTLFCLFIDCELTNFQEAAQDEKWRSQ